MKIDSSLEGDQLSSQRQTHHLSYSGAYPLTIEPPSLGVTWSLKSISRHSSCLTAVFWSLCVYCHSSLDKMGALYCISLIGSTGRERRIGGERNGCKAVEYRVWNGIHGVCNWNDKAVMLQLDLKRRSEILVGWALRSSLVDLWEWRDKWIT